MGTVSICVFARKDELTVLRLVSICGSARLEGIRCNGGKTYRVVGNVTRSVLVRGVADTNIGDDVEDAGFTAWAENGGDEVEGIAVSVVGAIDGSVEVRTGSG